MRDSSPFVEIRFHDKALACGGEFLTMHPDDHFLTNREVIQTYLPVKIRAHAEDRGRWRVVIE